MENSIERLYMNKMTRHQLYKLFDVRRVSQLQVLNDWLTLLPPLTEMEKTIATFYQNRLLDSIDDWNEQELSLGFIGPIINIIDFKVPYRLNFFAQRPLSGIIGDYEMIGKPDGMLAAGSSEPETPYFSFHEYKKDVDSSGDPAGQNLAAMVVGQSFNDNNEAVYGCYVVGRLWYFMALKGKEYAISRSLSADGDDIYTIVQHLKALRSMLFSKLNIHKD